MIILQLLFSIQDVEKKIQNKKAHKQSTTALVTNKQKVMSSAPSDQSQLNFPASNSMELNTFWQQKNLVPETGQCVIIIRAIQ